jgi:hypothetical protein
MLLYYLGTVLSYLVYQAAIGGLFFILAKANTNNPFIASTFLMVEPLLMLLLGIKIAKFVDNLRTKLSLYYYIILSSITMISFFCLYLMQRHHASYILILSSYSIVMIAFMIERIYRQRLPRDFSNCTRINHSQVNAIANLANRGAPILSPLVIYIFPGGLNEKFLYGFIIILVLSTTTFCWLAQKLTLLATPSSIQMEEISIHYQAEKLGIWHVWHLFLMNFMLGGLFMVLSQSVLSSMSVLHFLQGPSIYFAGFWVTMVFLMILPSQIILTPISGLYFTAALGIFLIISSCGGTLSAFALACAGMCYGFAINQLGTFIQSQLDHCRYSYYETRAQIFGRIALLMGLTITGWALQNRCTTDFLRGVMGFGVILSAALLSFIFWRIVFLPDRKICVLKN